jgi:hypothetical protein
MTNCEPDCKPTSRYSANEAAALLGIHRNSLRKYTDEGKIKCGFHKATLRKFYTGTAILAFWRQTM